MKKLMGLIALFVFAAVMSYAAEQTTTTGEGTAKAKIIQAAKIEEAASSALDFGTIVADTDGGTVTVTAAASPSRTSDGVNTVGNGFQADHFVMSNLDIGTTYDLSVPGSVTITRQGGSETMTVVPALSTGSVTAAAETADVYVGGQLTVGGNQKAGNYQGTYAVTVTY